MVPLRASLAACLLAAFAAPTPAPAAAELRAERVQQAIERGRDALLGRGAALADYPRGVGANALVVLTLLDVGVAPNESVIQQALDKISTDFLGDTYRTSLAAAALAAARPERGQAELRRAVAWLVDAQNRDGGWRYRLVRGGRQRSDHSCTQFALLGLHAAARAGVPVDRAVWRRAASYLERTQRPDGGWTYQGRVRESFGSMTAAGLSSLLLCERHADHSSLPCGTYPPNARIARGLAWLNAHFAADRNPRRGGPPFYYLYAVGRLGALLARPAVGSHSWYREGAAYLLRTQRPDGTWGDAGKPREPGPTESAPDEPPGSAEAGAVEPVASTCFALRFLARGRRPLLLQKVERAGRWNEDPEDGHRLTEAACGALGIRAAWQHVPLAAPVAQWARSPVLFLSGRELRPFTTEERAKLRRFVRSGGTLLFEAQCSAEDFDAGLQAEAKHLFPESSLRPLEADHPVYREPFAIPTKHRVLKGMWIACRTAVVYAPRDLSSAWAGRTNRGPEAVPADAALHMGTNVLAYARAIKPLQDRLAEPQLAPENDNPPAAPTQTVRLAILRHGGHWDARPHFPRFLARELSKHTAAPVAINAQPLAPTAAEMYQYPAAHMTGTRSFEFSPAQAQALRRYLRAGGFLFADACTGSRAFDAAFRAAMARVFPNHKLSPLPPDHPVYRACQPIGKADVLPPARREFPGPMVPRLEGITLDGRTAVIYSPLDIGCALETYPCPTCRGYTAEPARTLAVNLLVYGTCF
jgi:hypothetical protein